MQYSKQNDNDAASEWTACTDRTALDLRNHVAQLARESAPLIAERFYDAVLADPRSSGLLDHQVVNDRLHASLARWVTALFDPQVPVQRQVAIQRHTGEVHARVGVPLELLAKGAREIKRTLAERLSVEPPPPAQLVMAVQYIYDMVDLSVALMGATTEANSDRQHRADEAYRLFFLSQDMAAERERQRSRLLEWAQQILIRNFWEADPQTPHGDGIGTSEFSLWLEHKASILFEGAPEVAQIGDRIARIETVLLPRLAQARSQPDQARAIVATINEAITEVKALLSSMFDRYAAAEDGRDTVTPRLLSRRYFPTVAKREIAQAQRSGHSFALMLCDLDDFERARESIGAASADALLGVVADALSEQVRAGDFVFRIGDDQFLLLLVEMSPPSVMAVAEGLRQRIERTQPRTPGHAGVPLRASFGVAMHDGHPDYQRLFDRASDALRRAQSDGGNRCVLAD